MPTDSCSSISHIQTWLLQLHSDQPTRHHTTSIHHYSPQGCTTRQKLEAKVSHHPSSSTTPLASHQSANFIQNLCPHVQHPFRVMSALHVILGHTVHKSRIEIEFLLVCQRWLLNPVHVQLIWSTSIRRCWSIGVEQTTCLPPSRAIYRIIQNQAKNSSCSNLLRIIYMYSGHCALKNVERFRIRFVFSYRCSKKTVVLYCIVLYCIVLYCIVLYCIISTNVYSQEGVVATPWICDFPASHSHTVQVELDGISRWASDNNLTLNVSKSREMIIRGPRIPADFPFIPLQFLVLHVLVRWRFWVSPSRIAWIFPSTSESSMPKLPDLNFDIP